MPAVNSINIFDFAFILGAIRWTILIILVLYAIFALIIVRQVDLMAKTLITPVSPVVKAISIVHAGFAIGFIILAVGIL